LAESDALGEIHNRLLGACLAGDAEGLQLQTVGYIEVERQLEDDVRKVQEIAAAPPMQAIFAKLQTINVSDGLRTLQEQGVPDNIRAEFLAAGISEHLVTGLEEAARDPSNSQLITVGLASHVARIVRAVGGLMQAIQNEMPSILKGL
jgi:hypothetical protein